MKTSVEYQKLSYARSLLKKELARKSWGTGSYDAAMEGCRKAIDYCEKYKHYHPGIKEIIDELESRRKLIIQNEDEMSEFKSQEYQKRMEHKEWLRQSRI